MKCSLLPLQVYQVFQANVIMFSKPNISTFVLYLHYLYVYRPLPPPPRILTWFFLAFQIQILKTSEVTQHLPRECLPENLGGYIKIDLATWNFQFLPEMNGHPDPFDEIILFSLPPALDWDSVHVPGPHAMTVQELMDYVSTRQKRGIYEEYEDIRRENPVGTFHCSM